MSNSVTINVLGKEFSFERPKLRIWMTLEDIREDIIDAMDKKDVFGFAELVVKFLSIALPLEWDKVSWYETLMVFQQIEICLKPKDIPINEKKSKSKEIPWNYKGRKFYEIAHYIARSYGWSLEYISELDVDEALALIMEITVEEQLQREWEWGLSEKSVEYNSKTKTSKFRDLPRPNWMLPKIEPPKKIKMLKILIPSGNVIDLSGMDGTTTFKPS